MKKEQVQIRKVEIRAARADYKCECKVEGCQERIEKKEDYAVFKLSFRSDDSYRNEERKVSQKCEWFQKWREFIEPIDERRVNI